MRNEALSKAIDLAGGAAALARTLNISAQAISQWKLCPPDRVREVSSATGWQVMPAELRPDIAEQFAPVPKRKARIDIRKSPPGDA